MSLPGINPRSHIHSVPLLRYALLYMAGIIVADWLGDSVTLKMWILMLAGGILTSLIFHTRSAVLSSLSIMMAVMTVGGIRWHGASVPIVRNEMMTDATLFVMSKPTQHGKVMMFDAMICKADSLEERVGEKVRVSLMRDTLEMQHEALSTGVTIRADMTLQPLTLHDDKSVSDDSDVALKDNRIPTAYKRWLLSRGMTATALVGADSWEKTDDLIEGTQEVSHFERLSLSRRLHLKLLIMRQRLADRMAVTGMDEESVAVAVAMTLGLKDQLSSELRSDYSLSGASHILALSGMHLSILFMVLSYIIPGRGRVRILILLSMLWLYVMLTGMPYSVVRAATMLTIYSFLREIAQTQFRLNILSASLLLITSVSPLSLWDVGFEMSFMAVFSIICFAPVFERYTPHWCREAREQEKYEMARLQRLYYNIRRYVWALFVISLSAQAGTAPLAVYYFGTLPVAFLLTNFIVVPLATVIIVLTLLLYVVLAFDAMAGGAITFLTMLLAQPLNYVICLQNSLLSYIANLPYASFSGINISSAQLLLCYVILFVGVRIFLLRDVFFCKRSPADLFRVLDEEK